MKIVFTTILLATYSVLWSQGSGNVVEQGAITRGNPANKNIAIVFTGDEFFDGLETITTTLKRHDIQAGFFLTGRLYENRKARRLILKLAAHGHYFGPHSDQHLLYNDWTKRDSLLVTKDSLIKDLRINYAKMEKLGIKQEPKLFIPPFEHWNNVVANWCKDEGVQLISFTRGIPTNADYTYPEMKSYRSSDEILTKLFEKETQTGLNGVIMLIHIGTDPRRKDKFYDRLPHLIEHLKSEGYSFVRIDRLVE